MLANYTLQKQSVTSGDGISSAAINLCISFSKDALLLMLEDYRIKHPHNAEATEISNTDLQKPSAHNVRWIANDGIRPLHTHRFHEGKTHP